VADAGCVFCRIIAGEIPAQFVIGHGDVLAFLDARPLFPGHTLVVPREHVVTLPELAPDRVEPVFATVRRVAAAVVRGLDADGSFVAVNNVVSQSVLHLHVHVIPRRREDGLRGFFWPRSRYADDAEAEAVAARVRAALDAPGD
jgi:histidine triad (HIT) family protein